MSPDPDRMPDGYITVDGEPMAYWEPEEDSDADDIPF